MCWPLLSYTSLNRDDGFPCRVQAKRLSCKRSKLAKEVFRDLHHLNSLQMIQSWNRFS